VLDEGGHAWIFPFQVIKLHRDALLMALYISNANNLFKWIEQLRHHEPSHTISMDIDSNVNDSLASQSENQFREVILGACMLFRTDALQQVGLFDERFFLYLKNMIGAYGPGNAVGKSVY